MGLKTHERWCDKNPELVQPEPKEWSSDFKPKRKVFIIPLKDSVIGVLIGPSDSYEIVDVVNINI